MQRNTGCQPCGEWEKQNSFLFACGRLQSDIMALALRYPVFLAAVKNAIIYTRADNFSGSILTFKLWGSAYTRVMPHSRNQHSASWLSLSNATWTISRVLYLRGCMGSARQRSSGFFKDHTQTAVLLHCSHAVTGKSATVT